MSEELKPCPFDGGTPEAVELWDAINRYANASRLSVQRQVAVAEIGSVLRAAWNRRSSDAEVERMRAALLKIAASRPKGDEPPQYRPDNGYYDDCYSAGFERALWVQAEIADAAMRGEEGS